MERYAFEYAEKKYPFEMYRRKKGSVRKFQMKELFHEIAGTSTGAILAAVLSVKDDTINNTSYYASDVIDFFMNDGP